MQQQRSDAAIVIATLGFGRPTSCAHKCRPARSRRVLILRLDRPITPTGQATAYCREHSARLLHTTRPWPVTTVQNGLSRPGSPQRRVPPGRTGRFEAPSRGRERALVASRIERSVSPELAVTAHLAWAGVEVGTVSGDKARRARAAGARHDCRRRPQTAPTRRIRAQARDGGSCVRAKRSDRSGRR